LYPKEEVLILFFIIKSSACPIT